MTTGVETDAATVLLERARDRRAAADRAEVELLETTLAWADLHGDGSVVADPYGPLNTPIEGVDVALDLAGPGAPQVSDLAVVEYAAALRMTTDAGRRYVGDCLEIAHRLPRLHARLRSGDLPVWRARRVAQATRDLPHAGADAVDARVAAVAHRVGSVLLERLVEEARLRFDPEEAELRAAEAAEARRADICRPGPAEAATGLAYLNATLDLADALELDGVLSSIARRLAETDTAAQGWTDTLDVRRSRALGVLARGGGLGPEGTARDGQREIVLHLHATAVEPGDTALDPGGVGLARLENTRGFVTADAVRAWCAAPGTRVTVKPVIDLRDHVAVDAHEVPDRIAERVRLARTTCAFPYCTRPARQGEGQADCDHIEEFVPLHEGGPPGQTSPERLAPLCRRHHRAKTHPSPNRRRWRYRRDPLDPATFHWTSPHGDRYLVDPLGTVALSR